ncbi:MAG: hypothetical protein Q9191_005836 [Dirinaria sp. TL-2023a]
MTDSQTSSMTIADEKETRTLVKDSNLDLSGLPPIFVLSANISTKELHETEDELNHRHAPLTYDIKEANIVLGNISKPRRAKLELQWGGVKTQEHNHESSDAVAKHSTEQRDEGTVQKRRRLVKEVEPAHTRQDGSLPSKDNPATSETEDEDKEATKPMSQLSVSRDSPSPKGDESNSDLTRQAPLSPDLHSPEHKQGRVKVVNLEWLRASLSEGKPLPFELYTVYEGTLVDPEADVSKPAKPFVPATSKSPSSLAQGAWVTKDDDTHGIVERAKGEAQPSAPRNQRRDRVKDIMKQEFAGRSFIHARGSPTRSFTKPTQLLHQTTSEHDEAADSALPPMPDWVLQNKLYSCERSTPLHSPNEAFIEQLKKIRLARVLTGDEIGVRAYSTSIASLAAYPYTLSSAHEVLALPGCDHKIAQLFREWKDSEGFIRAVADIDADPVLSVLRLFYEIWGVGAITAREFYYDNGWRDLDDIIEHGWQSLSRVQQIGVKYYDEFRLPIPRAEVESIAAVVHEHGKRVSDPDLECIIVGGHRRGKPESGDVDLILSHRCEAQTANLISRVERSLTKAGWITHTLSLNLTNTKRGQQPLPLAPPAGSTHHGFDTLDKALVVWQSPDAKSKTKNKNPNPHRRVDIIVSPWRTVGCAVAGWTSGTTFQRDLRRYAKKARGWKFDSSGVCDRAGGGGQWVDLEGWTDPRTRAPTWQEAERRVFEGLGLVYREPGERCTG